MTRVSGFREVDIIHMSGTRKRTDSTAKTRWIRKTDQKR
jgi:hypothetical protein